MRDRVLMALVAGGVLALPARGTAQIPRYPDIMPVSAIRAGMVGYGLTVFRGTTIERFGVTVVGVVKNGSLIAPGHDMILVRMAGGPMSARQANLIKGMSGSPVYIGGKIIGAFSQGEPATKEPLGGITPIEDMLEAWDPKLSATPIANACPGKLRMALLPRPLRVGSRAIERIAYDVPLGASLQPSRRLAVMRPCGSVVSVSGFSKRARQQLARLLEPYNAEVMQGPAGGPLGSFKGAQLTPGAAFSVMLVNGDVSSGATGTVTYRKGNRILGFGHPLLGLGPLSAPVCSAYIYDVYPLLSGSYKISGPGPVAGALTQDRLFSVSGLLGGKPRTIPVMVEVADRGTGRAKTYRMTVVSHPNLTAGLASLAVGSAISDLRPTPGPAIARVETSIDAEDLGAVKRTNFVFDARAIDVAATSDLDELASAILSNPFNRLSIKSISVKVEIEDGRRTATIDRVFVDAARYEPGDTVNVGVVLRPYKQAEVVRKMRVTIPRHVAAGRLTLTVRGGGLGGGISIGGLSIRAPSAGTPELSPAVSVRQTVERLLQREKGNEIALRLALPSSSVSVDGVRLSRLPPAVDSVMRGAKSSLVRVDRDEVKVIEPTEWSVTGQQALTLNVQRTDTQETPSSSAGSGPTPGPMGQPGGASSALVDFSHRNAMTQQTRPAGGAPDRGKTPAPPARREAQPQKQAQAAADAGPAAPQASAASETPVARRSQQWRQTARADFAKGRSTGVAVTSDGDLVLTRTMSRWSSTGASYVWAVAAAADGSALVGTGTPAVVLRVDGAGGATPVAQLPETSVHALLVLPDGSVLAATGPRGRTYRVSASGAVSLFHEASEPYALCLARGHDGAVYVGTGGGVGAVYRVGPTGPPIRLAGPLDEHVLCVAAGAAGEVVVGTAPSGLVVRVRADGSTDTIYDAAEQSIAGIVVLPTGDLLLCTGPKGSVVRIGPGQVAKTVLEKASGVLTAIVRVGDRSVVVGTGCAYEVRANDVVVPLDVRGDAELLSVAATPDGVVYAGGGNPGDLWRATGGAAAGTYISTVHDCRYPSRWGAARWSATSPADTSVAVELRSGSVAEPDATWSGWLRPRGANDGGVVQCPTGRYLQYRVTLAGPTLTRSPGVRDITVAYRPVNQPPRVTVQAPQGGEAWSGDRVIRWEGQDPDKDTLTYEVFASAGGSAWTPVASSEPAKPAAATATNAVPAPSQTAPAVVGGAKTVQVRPKPLSITQVEEELDKHPGLPAAMRAEIVERTRKLNDEYRASSPSGAGGEAAPAPTRQASRSIDTRKLADGVYRFRVVATDAVSNPSDSMSGEAISEPIIICNALPVVSFIRPGTQVLPDRSVSAEVVAVQRSVPLIAAQWRVDGGEWTAAEPADGLCDTGVERFFVKSRPLQVGRHVLEVKVFNAAEGSSVDRHEVEVK